MTRFIEYAPLVVNALCLVLFLFKRPFEPGKALYWLGATILTVGLLRMRG